MWDAIIKAVDNTMERIQKGKSAGIDVANSQHGGAADTDSILSDQEAKEAKTAKNTVSGWKKAKNYGTNLSKAFANAGAIATGQGKQYDIENPSMVDFNKDVTKDFKAESTNTGKSK